MSNDIMLDIETLAKSERSVVLSIGAIAFDAEKFGEDIEHLPKWYSALDFSRSPHAAAKPSSPMKIAPLAAIAGSPPSQRAIRRV